MVLARLGMAIAGEREGEPAMHVHANQINPNAQLDALYSAQRAAARQEAARTRKKLAEFASEVTREADSEDGCVVKLGAREESEEPPERQGPRGGRKMG
jgi:hypothetical protein